MLHLRLHEQMETGEFSTFSLDFERHLDDLPREQFDAFELLQTPTPDPLQVPVHVRLIQSNHTLVTDALIFKYVRMNGPKWRDLARLLGGRDFGYVDDIVRNRYIRICDSMGTPYKPPRLRPKQVSYYKRKTTRPFERWTDTEDALVVSEVKALGFQWKQIATRFGGRRSPHSIRNRAARLRVYGPDRKI